MCTYIMLYYQILYIYIYIYIYICLTDLNNKLTVVREEGWGEGIVQEFGILMYTQLYLKWITNKALL